MHNRLITALPLVFVLLSATPASASQTLLKLEDVMQLATRTHPSVITRRDELEAETEGLETAKWQRFPSVALQTSSRQAGGGALTTLQLDQPLWTGGRLTAQIDTSVAKVDAANAAVGEAEQDILVRTAAAFTEIIRVQSRLEAATENLDEHQRLLDLITRRAESQISASSEVTMAKARYQQAKTELIQLQTLLANARAELEQLIGEPVMELKVPKPRTLAFANMDDAVAAALAYSPELRRLGADKQAADAAVRGRKAALWPTVSARHEQIWGKESPGSQTYLALTYSPGSGLSSLSAIREAESRRRAALSSRDSVAKDIHDQVRTDWNQFHSSQAEVAALRELAASSRTVYESFVRQYSAGRKTWIDVLNARKEAIQSRNLLADTEWGGFLAGLRIAIATGTLDLAPTN